MNINQGFQHFTISLKCFHYVKRKVFCRHGKLSIGNIVIVESSIVSIFPKGLGTCNKNDIIRSVDNIIRRFIPND